MAWYDLEDAIQWVHIDASEGTLHINEWMEYVPVDYMEFFLEISREVFEEQFCMKQMVTDDKEPYVKEVCHRLRLGPHGSFPVPTKETYLH